MSSGVLVAVVAVVVVGLLLVVRARVSRSRDGVDSFRRQIDALSPEARRPVVDQVQNAAGRIEPRPIDDDHGDDDHGDDDHGDEEPGEGGPRGA